MDAATLTAAKKRALLAKLVKERGLATASRDAIPRRAERGTPALSFAQRRLWFLERLDPGSARYNVFGVFSLAGSLDVAALEASVGEILRRHEALRTRVVEVAGEPVPEVLAAEPVRLSILDLSALAPTARLAERQRLCHAEARRPFDLSRGPFARFSLLRRSPTEHDLLVCLHHIASDAWSVEVLSQELLALYDAQVANRPSPLPEPPLQYADFAAWERDWLTAGRLDTQLAYWRRRLEGAPSLPLATDHPRPPSQRHRGAWLSRRLAGGLGAAVRELGQKEGATPFVTLLAAFQALLARYTGESDIAVGTPVANRNRAELEGLIGFFGNMLVLRTDVSDDPSFRQLVGRVRELSVGAYAHQDLPFEKLVEELRPERDLSRNPIFQVAFVLQQPPQAARSETLQLTVTGVDSGIAKFDLSLYVTLLPDATIASFEYDTDLFEAASVERLLEHYENLLRESVARPDARLSELGLLDAGERALLLTRWCATAADYPRDTCVHAAIEAQALARPEALAVAFGATRLTYAELDTRANRLAHRLRTLGAGPERSVAVCLERSHEMIVALLAVLKTGAAYLPLDPEYPRDRLAFMLGDSGARVLVTRSDVWEPATTAAVVFLDRDAAAIGSEPGANLEPAVAADTLAYVIYTSGSTGRPKGVEVTHRSLQNLVAWHQRAYGIGPADRTTQLAGPSFDASVWEIWPHLAAGASLHLPDEDTRRTPERLRRFLIDERISVAFLPTPIAEAVLGGDWAGSALRVLLTGGDRLHRVQGEAPPFRLVNHYGPTENAVVATCGDVACGESADPPIGRPIANVRGYVLDRRMQPLPIGIPGELFLAGESLARGYRGRPDLTAERFVPDPFASAPGGRLYRTGDLVRFRPDGQLDFLGRIDRQVKLRGLRVELGEIEAQLGGLPGVRDVLVLLREDAPGRRRLVAYVTPRPGAALVGAELRRAVEPQLPSYMVPSAVVVLDALPLTPNGKLDRAALPAPVVAEGEAGVAPRTPVEERLAQVWAAVLGVERVSVHDNFFELGGDSILSIQIVARAAEAGILITPRQLFQHQSVAELAAVAEAGQRQAEQGSVAGDVPLTPIQRWFFEQPLEAPQHFNQSVLLEATRPLDADVLESVLQDLLQHHDALRLGFTRGASGWRQENLATVPAPRLLRIELGTLPAGEQEAAIAAAAVEVQAGLDLERGRLLGAAWFDLGAGGGRLLLVIHHLAVDGVSWRILIEDLASAYGQRSRGETPRLPRKTTAFRDWARALEAHARTPAVLEERRHWLGLPALPALPIDRADGANLYGSVETVAVSLPIDETRAVLRRGADADAEINDRLLAALVLAAEAWTGTRALLVDMEGHGREDVLAGASVARTVGWFTTVYPVALRIDRDAGPARALAQVSATLRAVPAHGLGFGLLRYAGDPETAAALARLPVPELSFNYLGQFDPTAGPGALFRFARGAAGPNQDPGGRRAHSLDVSGFVSEQRLTVVFAYSTHVHSRRTIEGLSVRFLESLQSIVAQDAPASPATDSAEADDRLEVARAMQQVQFE